MEARNTDRIHGALISGVIVRGLAERRIVRGRLGAGKQIESQVSVNGASSRAVSHIIG